MRFPRSNESLSALLIAVAAATGFLRGDPGSDPDAERIAALVEQFGDPRFANRENAGKALEAIGEKALPALRKAEAAGKTTEIRRRAKITGRAILLASCKAKSIGLELVVIEPGRFSMGSRIAEPNRRPDETEHVVRISEPFLLGAREVTQEEYKTVMGSNPSWFSKAGDGKDRVAWQETERCPVENVAWFDAVEFCNRLSRLEKLEPYYAIRGAAVTIAGGTGYRLPTEAEWEYACRAGTATVYHFGDATRRGVVNCKPLMVAAGYGSELKWPDLGRPIAVGGHKPNAWGLYDMHGNVGEWCWDNYDMDYYPKSPADNPLGPDKGDHRVVRGGSWLVSEGSCRSASRYPQAPAVKNYITGFRVGRTP